jgi:hypothetical protein
MNEFCDEIIGVGGGSEFSEKSLTLFCKCRTNTTDIIILET